LLSQLEESKFVRLFRHIVNSSASVPKEGVDSGKPAVALDLPDAELYFKFAASVGSWGHHSAAWLFRLRTLLHFSQLMSSLILFSVAT